ncbi:thrombospondin type-1 domain-containing protein 7B-like [Xenia sp. Carnegie-2017]|uniref:thrombospondin type-1 domain-containing protein 7B-like n=1 Tax=Xenia sp. Carnegie-2017 TaxID=2897299 RepID=UPI001F046CAF|nr:thrombospondin type-1 domain-containing protein 7B-like [Xenia sp. Carnegie-2017]
MRPFLVFLFILLLLAFEGNCWRRRRRRRWWRRRRRCPASNCGVSHWSSWSSCSHQCGLSGVQTRTRKKTRTESCGGSCPYSFTQTRACNRNNCGNRGWSWYGRCICNSCWTGTCCHIARRRNCLVSSWTSWSSCNHQCGSAGVQTRTRYKTRKESCGGRCPYSLRRTRACNRNKCRNGGRPTYGRCICRSGWKGKCCNIRIVLFAKMVAHVLLMADHTNAFVFQISLVFTVKRRLQIPASQIHAKTVDNATYWATFTPVNASLSLVVTTVNILKPHVMHLVILITPHSMAKDLILWEIANTSLQKIVEKTNFLLSLQRMSVVDGV